MYAGYFDFEFLSVICNWALYHIRLNLSRCSDSEFFQSEFKKASCSVRPGLVRSELRQMLWVWMISGSNLGTINCEIKFGIDVSSLLRFGFRRLSFELPHGKSEQQPRGKRLGAAAAAGGSSPHFALRLRCFPPEPRADWLDQSIFMH